MVVVVVVGLGAGPRRAAAIVAGIVKGMSPPAVGAVVTGSLLDSPDAMGGGSDEASDASADEDMSAVSERGGGSMPV